MTKAAFVSLGLAVLFATAATLQAQTAPTETAIQEAVRRQADTITLRQKLADAKAAEARKDLEAAAKYYDSAYELSQRVGSGIDAESAEIVAGLVSVRMALASAAQAKQDYKEADAQISRVIKVDPKNLTALEFQKANNAAIEAQRGTIPSEPAKERAAEIKNEKIDASTLVQDGKLLYEMGKLEEAETKLKQALEIDADNRTAFQYLTLIKESRLTRAELKHEQISKNGLVEVAQAWEPAISRDKLPVPNPYVRSELVHTGKGRQNIISKLDRIMVDNVFYDGLPLGEVVRNLSEEAKKRDPEKKGINFIINPNAEASAGAAALPTVDPATGLPIAAPPVEAVDISGISVKINPALTDVRLADVLDAIIKVADRPIKYSIEDYAVVFSLRGTETAPLFTRVFKVDPNTFYQGLESVGAITFGDVDTGSGGGGGGGGGGRGGGGGGGGQGGQGGQGDVLQIPRVSVPLISQGGQQGGGGGQQFGGETGGGTANIQNGPGLRFVTRQVTVDQVQASVRGFFTAAGVDLAAPKSVFFNDRQGTLLVRATLQDLDIIESAIQALNVAPPQINIKARFAQITQNNFKALGFDWYLGNVLMNNGRIGASGGSQPSYQGSPSLGNPEGTFPGNVAGGTTIPSSFNDSLITGGLRGLDNTPALASITGVLTDPQFRVVIRALDQQDGTDLLTAPEVTTLSGRQAQVQVVDIPTIVTGVDASQQGGNAQATAGTGGSVVQQAAPVITYTVQPLPFGPTLDVIPYVSADGYTIQMTLIPTVTEFLGYDDPGEFVTQAGNANGQTLVATLPLPHFRVRQVTTSCIVWDGQTVVLGGLITEDVLKLKDKVPLLGSIPLLGKLFRSESTSTSKRNLVIFVTPTIIDPAGNRVHSEDEMPFAQNSIPVQPNKVVTP